jgi:hypothetical protein
MLPLVASSARETKPIIKWDKPIHVAPLSNVYRQLLRSLLKPDIQFKSNIE